MRTSPFCGGPLTVALPDELPRPTVDVTSRESGTGHEVDLTVSRENVIRKYEGGKATVISRDAAFKECVEKLLADPHTAEFLPPSKKP